MHDDITILYRKNCFSEEEKQAIWEILCECDNEFYPPLSARESSAQKTLQPVVGHKGEAVQPTMYFQEMIQQDFLLAYHNEEVIGFMTFRTNYIRDALKDFGESLYITTVAVLPSERGRGVSQQLYQYMEETVTDICQCNRISTRTWSLNITQLHVLEKRGYQRLAVLKDDRGAGVDTIYFGLVYTF